MAERERSRWIVALVAPLVAACAFLCAVFATAGGASWTNWLFLPVILLVPTWVVTLQYLALTSDTNTADERVDALPVPSSTSALDRKAA